MSSSRAISFVQGGDDEERQPLLNSSSPKLSKPTEEDSPPELSASVHVRQKSSTAKPAIERRTRERFCAVFVSSGIAAIPALLVGFTIGYPSSVLLDLQGDSVPEEQRFNILMADLFGGLSSVGAMFGGPIAGWIADYWGRKPTLLITGIPYLVGYLMIVYAHFITGSSHGFRFMMLFGRFLTGVGLGSSCLTVPIYTGEISSAKLRGIFGSFTELFIAAGLTVVYSLSAIPGLQYYNIALVAVGIAAAFELCMVWLYDTPRWLFANGDKMEAKQVLQWLRGPKVCITAELDEMEAAISGNTQTILHVFKEFTKRSVLVPFVLLLIVMFLQQIGGLNAIASYVSLLFEEGGVPNPRLMSVFAIGLTGLVAVLISVFLVDLAGRKILLITSGIGMLVGTTMLGTHFFITRPSLCADHHNSTGNLTVLQDPTSSSCNSHFAPLAITSIILFNTAFSFGWGPVPWVLTSELLPMQVRGVASGISTFVNWGTGAIVAGVYFNYAEAVTPWFAWWSFSLLNFLGVLFVIFFIPETKGKTLEAIQLQYEKKTSNKEVD